MMPATRDAAESTAGPQAPGISHAEFEKSEVILRGPGKQVQNSLKHSQSDRAFFSNRNDEAESLLSGRLKKSR
jgi:hypothetical protein